MRNAASGNKPFKCSYCCSSQKQKLFGVRYKRLRRDIKAPSVWRKAVLAVHTTKLLLLPHTGNILMVRTLKPLMEPADLCQLILKKNLCAVVKKEHSTQSTKWWVNNSFLECGGRLVTATWQKSIQQKAANNSQPGITFGLIYLTSQWNAAVTCYGRCLSWSIIAFRHFNLIVGCSRDIDVIIER